MNFLTTAFGVLFMVGFLYGAGHAMREDSADKLARYKRMADEAAERADAAQSVKEAQQAGAGIPMPSTARRAKHR